MDYLYKQTWITQVITLHKREPKLKRAHASEPNQDSSNTILPTFRKPW